MRERQSVDVAIIGGGIAGSSLAIVMARAGLDVLVLERQGAYEDHVRGETMWPWGVAEAQRLGIYEVLTEAGGHLVDWFFSYDEDKDPEKPGRNDLRKALPDVPGSLNVTHPVACEALATAASAAGASLHRGVTEVDIQAGPKPEVAWRLGEGTHRTSCRLIVGADGRSSAVRRQTDVPLHRDPPAHLIAGLLIEGLDLIPEDVNFEAREDDLMMMNFPQGEGRARVYLCFPPEERQRFAGPHRHKEFIKACGLQCVPNSEWWTTGQPGGPCATFKAEDTWTDPPYVEGAVLIGDAAGHNNPLIAQGTSMAMRDVRVLSEVLVGSDDWSVDALSSYGDERTDRLRKVRFVAEAYAGVHNGFRSGNGARRAEFRRYMREAPSVMTMLGSIARGPDHFPEEATDPQVWAEFEAAAKSPTAD